MIKIPENLWMIFDPIDGMYFYRSEKEALKAIKKWEREDRDVQQYTEYLAPVKYTRSQ